MRLRTLTLALMLSVSAFTPAMAATPTAEAFDHAVAAGQKAFDLTLDGTTHHITGFDRLDIELAGPDGRPGAMFTARADGRDATIVRLGDDIDLTFDDERASPDRAPPASRAARPMAGQGPVDDVVHVDYDEDPTRDDGRPGEGLNVYVFLHKSAKEHDQAKFLNWYLTWWFKEMKRDIVPGKHVRVFLHDAVPGLTDMNMNEGTKDDHLKAIHMLGFRHVRAMTGGKPGMSRFLLVVGPPPASWGPGHLGWAEERSTPAMVSNTGNRHVVAHELGHLIGAVHEDAQTFPCASNMAPSIFALISCQWYTAKNQQNIREFLQPRI